MIVILCIIICLIWIKYDSLRKDLEISETLIDDKIRYRELINWLTYLKGNFSSI